MKQKKLNTAITITAIGTLSVASFWWFFSPPKEGERLARSFLENAHVLGVVEAALSADPGFNSLLKTHSSNFQDLTPVSAARLGELWVRSPPLDLERELWDALIGDEEPALVAVGYLGGISTSSFRDDPLPYLLERIQTVDPGSRFGAAEMTEFILIAFALRASDSDEAYEAINALSKRTSSSAIQQSISWIRRERENRGNQ